MNANTLNTSGMNGDQSEAAMHLTGPCLVIAPPGSGKTFTLTERIRYLTQEMQIEPASILVITFTKAAAIQMKERYLRRAERAETAVTFGTIHAVCFGILRTSFGYDAGAFLSQIQRVHLVQEILEDIERKKEDHDSTCRFDDIEPEQVLEEISKMKNRGKSPEEYETSVTDKELFREIATQYLLRCRCSRKLDFDDMVLKCLEELHSHSDILKNWQDKFRYLLVDEVQDIDRIQYQMIRLLAKPQNNLFMVGDDDQSIYGFRGADPSLMLLVEKNYPDIQKIKLHINYRSTKEIVDAANALIAHNYFRYEKKIISAQNEKGKLYLAILKSAEEQNRIMINRLREIKENETIAIIARTNSMLTEYAGILGMQGIPFQCREKMKNPYENSVVMDMEAYLKLAIGEADRSDFIKIMNKPVRYLSRGAVPKKIADWKEQLMQYYADKNYMQHILNEFSKDMDRIRCFSPFAALNYIRYGMGYEEAVGKKTDEKERDRTGGVLDFLMNCARKYDSHAEFLKALTKARQSLTETERDEEEDKKITLITMHGAKGLEYDHVWIPDLNECVIPHRKAYLPEAVEEERRLLYVAMTRAKKSLFLSSVYDGKYQKKEISRFLKELMQSLKERNIPFQMIEDKE